MKNFCAVLFLLVAATAAQASPILIYFGTESSVDAGNHSTSRAVGGRTIYILDAGTYQEVSVLPQSDKAHGKTYLANNPYAFYLNTVSTSVKASQSLFLLSNDFTTDSNTHTYTTDIEMMTGNNSVISVGGSMTGVYPKTMKFVSQEAGQTNGSSFELNNKGTYVINLSLTQQANGVNDSLSQAVSLVENYLQLRGYSPF